MLLAEGEEAAVLPATSSSLRALQLPQRPGLPVAEQDHHPGRRLRLQRHLQLHHPAAGALPLQDLAASDHSAARAQTRHCLPRRHLLLSAGLLDARLHRLVSDGLDYRFRIVIWLGF